MTEAGDRAGIRQRVKQQLLGEAALAAFQIR